jgi:hypothetical protein
MSYKYNIQQIIYTYNMEASAEVSAEISPNLHMGTVYPTQEPLEHIENTLPIREYTDKTSTPVEVAQIKKDLTRLVPTGSVEGSIEYLWTNDVHDIITTTSETTPYSSKYYLGTCNLYLNPTSNPDLPHPYFCNNHKIVYTVPSTPSTKTNFDFTFRNKPEYTLKPYTYIHKVLIYNVEMNLYNMFISTPLSILLEQEYIKLALKYSIVPTVNTTPILKIRRNVLGQLIINREIAPENKDLKLQINIRPEYMLWAIETLFIHCNELFDLGLFSYKFMFLHGEQRLVDKYELYPPPNPTPKPDYMNIYSRKLPLPETTDIPDVIRALIESTKPFASVTGTESGASASASVADEHFTEPLLFKREIVNASTLVFYLKTMKDNNYKPLIDRLIQLFPDEYNLSDKLPRYNMRLTNTINFSIGGNNEGKYKLSYLNIPLEYQLILSNEKLRQTHKLFPRYVSNHTIINDDNTVNNILSYSIFLPQDCKSIKQAYSKYNLLEYYDNIFSKLGIEPLLTSGGKKTKKLRKTRKTRNKNKKQRQKTRK